MRHLPTTSERGYALASELMNAVARMAAHGGEEIAAALPHLRAAAEEARAEARPQEHSEGSLGLMEARAESDLWDAAVRMAEAYATPGVWRSTHLGSERFPSEPSKVCSGPTELSFGPGVPSGWMTCDSDACVPCAAKRAELDGDHVRPMGVR